MSNYNGIYKHFKGDYCAVLGIAKHTILYM